MQKISIECQFVSESQGMRNAPIDFFIGKPKKYYLPLEFQIDWLKTHRNGFFPTNRFTDLLKLHRIAVDNNTTVEEILVEFDRQEKGATQNITQDEVSQALVAVEGNIMRVDFKKRKKVKNPGKSALVEWYEKNKKIAAGYVEDIAESIISPIDEYKYSLKNILVAAAWVAAHAKHENERIYDRMLQNFANDDPLYNLAVIIDCLGGDMPPQVYKHLATSYYTNSSAVFKEKVQMISGILKSTIDTQENPFDDKIIREVAGL